MKEAGEEAMLLRSNIRTLLHLPVFSYVEISLFFMVICGQISTFVEVVQWG